MIYPRTVQRVGSAMQELPSQSPRRSDFSVCPANNPQKFFAVTFADFGLKCMITMLCGAVSSPMPPMLGLHVYIAHWSRASSVEAREGIFI